MLSLKKLLTGETPNPKNPTLVVTTTAAAPSTSNIGYMANPGYSGGHPGLVHNSEILHMQENFSTETSGVDTTG